MVDYLGEAMERWKAIKGYEGLYEVSDLGRVRSMDMILPCKNNSFHSRKGKMLSPQNNGKGYVFVNLRKSGKGEKHYIHRLVAEAFVENNKNLPLVNHKNEIKDDNRASNLEWCDNTYNINYGSCLSKITKKMAIPIVQELHSGEIVIWDSIREIERQKKFSRKIIAECCKGIRMDAYNSRWRYVT